MQTNMMYRKDLCLVKNISSSAELRYAAKIESAAPTVPNIGTKTIKNKKNVMICTVPESTSILELDKLFSIEIMFMVIEDGIMAKARMRRICSPDSYSAPMKERIVLGATNNTTTIGAVKLRLIRRLLEERSFFKADEDGITI